MKPKTMQQLEKAMEHARRQGYAVIGFAVNPTDGGLLRLDNQHMDKDQFVAMVGESLNVFANYTDDGTAKLIVN